MRNGPEDSSKEPREVRWHYRLANFSRAYGLLCEAMEGDLDTMSPLEMEGTTRRFEFTFELGWKLLKDRLEYAGVRLVTIAPRPVVRAANEARLIEDADAWMSMVDDRNRTPHICDKEMIDDVIANIRSRYLPVLGDLHDQSLEAKRQ